MLFRWRSTKYRYLLIVLLLAFVVICIDRTHDRNVLKGIESWSMTFLNVIQPPVVVTMRQNLTFFTNISTGEIRLDTNISHAEFIFHKYSSEMQVICPESKRLGNAADGGWDICLYSSYRIRSPCLVYSFGINNDWSFDDSVVATFNCTVRAFDPSMKVESHRRGNNIWFYKQGISGSDTVNSNGWQLHTLESFIRTFNETDVMIDYLKIDVEYSEWSTLEHVLNTTVLSRVKQFGLETHSRELQKKPSSIEDLVYYSGILRRLQAAGFYRWYWHFNKYGVFVSKNTQKQLTCCYEMVFINVNIPYS